MVHRFKKIVPTHNLYPKYGIHWSKYGTNLAGDSLIRYMESITGKRIPQKKYTGFTNADGLSGKEYDLGELLNLHYPLSATTLQNPITVFETDSTKYRPNVLIIGDSYWWNIYDTGLPDNQFNEYSFLFYFNTANINKNKDYRVVAELNLQSEIEKANFVILTTTETNDNRFPFGFPEKALASYGDAYFQQIAEREKQIQLRMDDVRFNKQWMNTIPGKAKANGVFPEEQIRLDAEWLLLQQNK